MNPYLHLHSVCFRFHPGYCFLTSWVHLRWFLLHLVAFWSPKGLGILSTGGAILAQMWVLVMEIFQDFTPVLLRDARLLLGDMQLWLLKVQVNFFFFLSYSIFISYVHIPGIPEHVFPWVWLILRFLVVYTGHVTKMEGKENPGKSSFVLPSSVFCY